MSQQVFPQLGGNNTYEFLNLPSSARVSALGGNLISAKDNDLNVALSNPSLLSDSMNGNVALSFVNYFADIKYGNFAVAKHFKHGGNFCAGITYLNYGKLTRSDEAGTVSGTFTASETCLNLAYAHPILDSNLTLGINMKTVNSKLDIYNSLGTALDFGVTYVIPKKNITVAAVVKNVGLVWKTYVDGHKENLPFEVQLGASYKPRKLPVRVSLAYENLEQWDLVYHNPTDKVQTDPVTGEVVEPNKYKEFGDKLMRHIVVGTEFIITKNLFLRVGYNYQRKVELTNPAKDEFSGCSFGFGFRVYKFHFSYGRAVYNLAGPTNTFSMSFNVNSFYKK